MALKKQLPKNERKQLSDYELAFLLDESERLQPDSKDTFYFDQLTFSPEEKILDMEVTGISLLKEYGSVYLEQYIAKNPGRRPAWWWTHVAPEEKCRMLKGKGQAAWDAGLAIFPRWNKGIPAQMVIKNETNWPRFESEASYLDRRGLLTAGEKKKLKSEDFEVLEEADCTNQAWVLNLKL